MASFGYGKSRHEIDVEAVKRYNKLLKASLDREERMLRHNDWRGNKLPPFSIEPMATERARLQGSGMTEEQRAARKQWVMDQRLSPNEPRHIPELTPRNPIRRFYQMPWNAVFKALKPVIVS